MSGIGTELLPGCKICGKVWERREIAYYVYHDSVGVVCKHHKGVEEWYNKVFEDMDKELGMY